MKFDFLLFGFFKLMLLKINRDYRNNRYKPYSISKIRDGFFKNNSSTEDLIEKRYFKYMNLILKPERSHNLKKNYTNLSKPLCVELDTLNKFLKDFKFSFDWKSNEILIEKPTFILQRPDDLDLNTVTNKQNELYQLYLSKNQYSKSQLPNNNEVLQKINFLPLNYNGTPLYKVGIEMTKKKENNSFLLIHKTEKILKIENVSEPIAKNFPLMNVYNIHNELMSINIGLLNYFSALNPINDWYVLEKGCKMFNETISGVIEYHKSSFPFNMTFFRQKYYNEKLEMMYKYLVVKGGIEKKFKRLFWNGDNIFLIDCLNIGKGVSLNENIYIGPNCKIGDYVSISNNCFLKKNVEVEKNTFISHNNYFGEGCKIGDINYENDFLNNYHGKPMFNRILGPFETFKKGSITLIGSFNYFNDNVVIPYGLNSGDRKHYSYD